MKFRVTIFTALLWVMLSGQGAMAAALTSSTAAIDTFTDVADWSTAACGATAANPTAITAGTDTFTICSGHTLTLAADTTNVAGLTVAGTLAMAGKKLTMTANGNIVNSGTISVTNTDNLFITLSGTGTYSGTGTLTSKCLSAAASAFDSAATWGTATAACGVTVGTGITPPLPSSGSILSIGANAISPPAGVGPFSVASIVYTSTGSLTLTGKTLNVSGTVNTTGGSTTASIVVGAGGTLNIGGALTAAAPININGGTLAVTGATDGTSGGITTGTNGTFNSIGALTKDTGVLNISGGTLRIGAAADISGGTGALTLTNSVLKLSDADHQITTPASSLAFPIMDFSELGTATTPPTAKTVTFVGGAAHTITSLALPAAAATTKQVSFVVPGSSGLTISATTVNTMTCTDSTVTGVSIAIAASTTAVCTVAAGAGATSAPIFSTKEKAKVFVEEVNN